MLRCFWHPSAVLLLAVLAVLPVLLLCGVAARPMLLLPGVKALPHSCCLSCGCHVTHALLLLRPLALLAALLL